MIEAIGVSKRFDKFQALNTVSCKVPEGSIYGMVGSNGAGKSTLLRLMTGIYRPTEGEVLIDGEGVFENINIKSKIAFVPDELYFLAGATLERMSDFYKNVYKSFDENKARKLIELFELPSKKTLNTYSKGMRRQAATILALSCNPDYMFFDETFDGLDPIMRNLVKKIVCEDVMERNATAVITSHSLRELEDTCDQLALLHKGGLVMESDVENLKTTLFKVQIAFSQDYDKTKFSKLSMLHFSKKGSVASMIISGDKEETISYLMAMNPALIDILPLSLEEVFTYEMEALGYSFQEVMEG